MQDMTEPAWKEWHTSSSGRRGEIPTARAVTSAKQKSPIPTKGTKHDIANTPSHGIARHELFFVCFVLGSLHCYKQRVIFRYLFVCPTPGSQHSWESRVINLLGKITEGIGIPHARNFIKIKHYSELCFCNFLNLYKIIWKIFKMRIFKNAESKERKNNNPCYPERQETLNRRRFW